MKVARDDWLTGELRPIDSGRRLPYFRRITPWAAGFLRHGFVPREMEDHWFIFEEDGVVHLYRSWTGIEFATFELRPLPDGGAEVVEVRVSDEAEIAPQSPGRLARLLHRERRQTTEPEDLDGVLTKVLDFFFDSLAGVPTGSDLARHVFGLNTRPPSD
jgi:hypothetical protein